MDMHIVSETKDSHGGVAWVVTFDEFPGEFWWTLDKLDFEGPFDTMEDAKHDLP